MHTLETIAGNCLPRHLASNDYTAARRCVHTVARKTVSTLFTLNASAKQINKNKMPPLHPWCLVVGPPP